MKFENEPERQLWLQVIGNALMQGKLSEQSMHAICKLADAIVLEARIREAQQ